MKKVYGKTTLGAEIEKEVADWILYRAETGSHVVKQELLDTIQAEVIDLDIDTPFTNKKPSRHWYE